MRSKSEIYADIYYLENMLNSGKSKAMKKVSIHKAAIRKLYTEYKKASKIKKI